MALKKSFAVELTQEAVDLIIDRFKLGSEKEVRSWIQYVVETKLRRLK